MTFLPHVRAMAPGRGDGPGRVTDGVGLRANMPPVSRIAPSPRAAIRGETALMAAYPGIYRHGMPTAGVIPAVAGRVEAISRVADGAER